MTLGPVMLDLCGTELSPEESEALHHPLVGGVILFSRNYASPSQLCALTQAIHAVRQPPLLIAVDHEGGRVQRFREGFTRIPAMRRLGEIWDQHPQQARKLAHQTGYVLAAELRACGVDFSFTPVLDIDYGSSQVIGDRAFHRSPQAIAELAHDLMLGMKEAGMPAVAKHFPGHGYVVADSHLDIPVDERDLTDIQLFDLEPFRQMIHYGGGGDDASACDLPQDRRKICGLFCTLVEGHFAWGSRLRWRDFQRRSKYGSSKSRRRCRQQSASSISGRLRYGAGLQRPR